MHVPSLLAKLILTFDPPLPTRSMAAPLSFLPFHATKTKTRKRTRRLRIMLAKIDQALRLSKVGIMVQKARRRRPPCSARCLAL